MRIFLIIFMIFIFASSVIATEKEEYLVFKVKKSVALQSLDPFISKLKGKYDNFMKEIDNLNVLIANALTKKEKLAKELRTLEGDIKELEKDIQIKQLQKQVEDLKAEIEEYESEDETEDEDEE